MRQAIQVGFDDICSLVTDGTHDSPKLLLNGIPFIKGTHISSGKIDFENCDYISIQDHAKCIKRVKPQRNDILVANIGSIGDTARVTEEREFSIKNVALLRPDPQKICSLFLFYLIKNHSFKKRMLNLRAGAAQQFISLKALRLFKFEICSNIVFQQRISAILSSYDDLIENNQRRIQLLEESARLLYREWFVHLRFPGHERAKVVDGLPEGWERVPLGQICFQYKKTVQPKDVPTDTPYIGLEHIPRRSITLAEWETSEKVSSTKYVFSEDDILFGKIRPYFHKVGVALCDGITSSDTIVLRVTEEKYYCYVVGYVSCDAFVRFVSKTCREGSKMPRADWRFVEKQMTVVPSDSILLWFSEQVSPILKQLKFLTTQNQKLAQARDILLPRLMNGEIEI